MKVVSSHTGGFFLVWTVAVQLILCVSGVSTTEYTKNCKLFSESESERKVLSRIEPLANKNFTVESKSGNDSYRYVFQLCGDAGGIPGAGLIQVDSKAKTAGSKTTVVGMYNATQAIGGSDWVMLIYRNGEPYDGHCSKEKRKAIIHIGCNRSVSVGALEVVLEDRERKQECFYLFELDTDVLCPPVESHLSTGSILLIIGSCFLAVYLIGGFLYQRLIVGAKGMDQFPNYNFWVEFGNLTADGCDLVCRSRSRDEVPAYRGMATEPLDEEPEERDDHLLPV